MELIWPKSQGNWKEVIASLNKAPVFVPFHHQVISFFQSLSKIIMKDKQFRQYPELIALAYWMRRSHVLSLQDEFSDESKERYLRARGTVLQFAPSNVDTIFVYSWVLSLLAGNRCIIRISRKQSEQSGLLINAIEQCLNQSENIEVSKRVVILSYDHSEEITMFLSKNCHVRVIWGGDSTVNAIRSVPLAPLATEIVFPDRFSLSVFKATSILELNEERMIELVHNFYNDSFWFGQMACSSPRLIVWEGNQQCIDIAKEKFWKLFQHYIVENYKGLMSATQVQKLTTSYLYATEEEVKGISVETSSSRVEITKLTNIMREEHCGGGLFIEHNINTIIELPSILHDKDQTLSYFGFRKEELVELVHILQNRGIDRVVPVGQALNFDEVWDGYRLLTYFTREIVIA